MKKIFLLLLLFTTITYSQSFENTLENILKDIVEINFYTSKGETEKLIYFLEKRGFLRSSQDKQEMRYFRLRQDNTLDFVVLIRKDNSEFNLVNSSGLLWSQSNTIRTLDALESIVGLPKHMYNDALKAVMNEEKVSYKIISNKEFHVIPKNSSPKIYKMSDFSRIGFKSSQIKDKNGNQTGYNYKFGYLYPPSKTLLFIDYYFMIDKSSGKNYQWISVPTKQPNISKNTSFNSSFIN